MYKLGIDVGGTNTDAVIIDENNNVIADIKNPTSMDIYQGIMGAIRNVLDVSGVEKSKISQAMLGTTQCTNAIVERKNLAQIGILRIGAPATLGVSPMIDWPEDFYEIVADSIVVNGGYEYDGREITTFDEEEAKKFFYKMKETGVCSIAISGAFSTIRNEQEQRAAELCKEIMGDDVHISLSSEIG